MKSINFNDTAEYQFMDILGIEGAFTSSRIFKDSLPEGFYKYSMRDGNSEFFSQICHEVLVNHAGDFITKEPLDLGPDGTKTISSDDWSFSSKNFDNSLP